MNLSVAALIATYRRPRELQRLLLSLTQVRGLAAVIVVDNEGSEEVRALIEKTYSGARYINPGTNAGCGGGLKIAEEQALRLQGMELTHLLILDDDAALPPDTLTTLAEVMEREHADLAYPLVTGEDGRIGWLPGLKHRTRELRDSFDGTPEEFRTRFGVKPRDFVWAQGICLLVTRPAMERCGLHRNDFWVRGEDLEFSLRYTARGRGILVPSVAVQHLPPADNAASLREAEYLKHCALLQNMAYIVFRLPHGRRIAWTIPGALRRFVRVLGWRPSTLVDGLRALIRGAILARPAGHATS